MNDKIFATLWAEALEDNNKEVFVSDWALSSIWAETPEQLENPELLPDPAVLAEQVGRIWDVAHMSVADIRKITGLSQAGFAERFCIPKTTIQKWESKRGGCADYIRLMMARHLGLI